MGIARRDGDAVETTSAAPTVSASTPSNFGGHSQSSRERQHSRRTDGGEMLGKVFALTVVIGLLVTGSAAFVAKHPSAVSACAIGVLAKPLPAAGCN